MQQVEEMVCFKDRLLNSVQFANSAIEQMLSEINWQIKSYEEVVTAVNSLSVNLKEEAAKWAELRDNRDLAVILTWDYVPVLVVVQFTLCVQIFCLRLYYVDYICLCGCVCLEQRLTTF
jgi:hypothetical protein